MATKEKVLTAAQFLRKHYIKTAIFINEQHFRINAFFQFEPLYTLTNFKQLNAPNIYICNNKFLIAVLAEDNACQVMKNLGSIGIKFFINISLTTDKNIAHSKQIFIIKKVIVSQNLEVLNDHNFVKTSSKINNFVIDFLNNQNLKATGTLGWTKETLTNTSPLVVLKNLSAGAVCIKQTSEDLTILSKTKHYEFSEVLCTPKLTSAPNETGACFVLLACANEFVKKIASKKRIRIRRKAKKTIENLK